MFRIEGPKTEITVAAFLAIQTDLSRKFILREASFSGKFCIK